MPDEVLNNIPFFILGPDGEYHSVEFYRCNGATEPPINKPCGEIMIHSPASRLKWQLTFANTTEPYTMRVYYIAEYVGNELIMGARVIEHRDGEHPPTLPPAPEGFKDAIVTLTPGKASALILVPNEATSRDDFRTFVFGDEWEGRSWFYSIQETPLPPVSGEIDA